MTTQIHESVALEKAAPAQIGSSGKMRVTAITPGTGSSGYYSADVLEAAAKDRLIQRGTPVHFDHASESERTDRPERSVRDIAGVFTGDATWDGKGLVGEVQIFAPYRELVAEMAPFIGLSISGSATDIVEGDVDGSRARIIEGLAAIDSVDLVTKAGRGGKIDALLESARTNARAIARGVAEATVNDRREALVQIVRDTHGDDTRWVWVRDFDDSTVWFDIESGDDQGTWQQTYIAADGVPTSLTGDRTEVRPVTQYVPVSPAGQPITQESKEDTMATTQIEESELSGLREKAGRVPTLESERDTAIKRAEEAEARADVAEAEVARRDRVAEANKVIDAVAEAKAVEFDGLQRRGLTVDLPTTEAGAFDEVAFKTAVEAEADKIAARGNQTGGLHGFGPSGGVSEADKAFDDLFSLEQKGA